MQPMDTDKANEARDGDLDLAVDCEGVVTLPNQQDKRRLVVIEVSALEGLLTLVSEYYMTDGEPVEDESE